MNNTQFRNLVLDTPNPQNDASSTPNSGTTPSTLGTKRGTFMPMTPRNVKGGSDIDFARQVRERNAALQPKKKFKSVAPKGVKYGAGYTDRAKARAEEAEGGDDKAGRIQALEEQVKLGQISQETFETLREEITGGEIGSTHLVKGLDRKLLERVRRGEDVLGVGAGGKEGSSKLPEHVDEELDKLEEMEVQVVKKDKAEKKGSMAPPPLPVAGVKRSRDEIMAELKAQRKAAAEVKAAPVLDSRWRKVGEEKNRIKVDHKGRQVIITVDEDGVVKKKVRKMPTAEGEQGKDTLDMPDESKPVLGADVVIPQAQKDEVEEAEEEDDDIFEGVGTEYDPLGNDNEDDSGSDEEEDDDEKPSSKIQPTQAQPPEPADNPIEPAKDAPKPAPRNYFNDTSTTTEDQTQDRMAGVHELLKKASKMDSADKPTDTKDEGEESDEEKNQRLKKRAQMLAQQDRDLDDMDMGFGSSRYDDGEEEEGDDAKVRLSEWKGSGPAVDDDVEGGGKGGGKKKTRKPKKRKGDANNMADIMKVIEGRKAGGGK